MLGNGSTGFSCGGIEDAVAIHLVSLDHYVTEVDPDAQLHPALWLNAFIFGFERGLDLHRALDGVDDAGELRQHAITGGVYEPPVMLFDETVDSLAV
jgi:hypothetical protein